MAFPRKLATEEVVVTFQSILIERVLGCVAARDCRGEVAETFLKRQAHPVLPIITAEHRPCQKEEGA
jgi:ornithine carbamoyltransferase